VIFYTFEPAKHLHAGKRYNTFDVLKTFSRLKLKVKYICGSTKSKVEK